MSTQQTKGGVTVKMFVGCQINSELRMHLKYSESWQQKKVLPMTSGEDLQELRYEGKEYVGALLNRGELTMAELRAIAEEIREVIRTHCPELAVDKLDMCVFPQLFLA